MGYQLMFFKEHSRHNKLDGYKALHCVSNPEESRSHYYRFEMDNTITPIESYNLLCGRAVLKDRIWLQFDLCDKDLNDNYHIKEFHPAYGMT